MRGCLSTSGRGTVPGAPTPLVATAGLAVAGSAVILSTQASAAAGCSVNYAISSQSGSQVTARNLSYNASIGTNANVSFGFNGAWNGSNPVPTSFALNGVTCNGGTTTPTTPPTSGPPPSTPPPTTPPPTTPPPTGSLPNSFRWNSSAQIIAPKPDGSHSAIAVKDPSIVYHNGRYHVVASTVNSAGNYNMVYMNFTDFAQAGSAQHHYLDTTAIGTGYKTAPHVFFFASTTAGTCSSRSVTTRRTPRTPISATRRGDHANQPVQPAVPVSGPGSQRGRQLQHAALAARPDHADQLHLLIRRKPSVKASLSGGCLHFVVTSCSLWTRLSVLRFPPPTGRKT
ncbi:cellulose binding domain-containing protein [Micromonospora sp. CPCC 205371]|nr:cellulose binding domain-containing protein [Micromonospora sp. CPCC 205371]